ncbi:acetoin utilization AcuB family protein [Niallia sp. Krafla_26]|uniref:acetoin utilization AcuB family protein n=1 Tax=Niallia sp. Krafla_26 TaxID=3064703 RepID=UPI003D16EE70
MIVEEIMTKKLITLKEYQTILEAHTLMHQYKIRHIPITDEKDCLIGLISDRDIRDALPSILLDTEKEKDVHQLPVNKIMQKDIITGHPLDFVEEIGSIFYEHKISCLPIVQDHKLVGIITTSDLLHSLVELTGAHQPGSQIEVKVPNQAGVLYEVTKFFHVRKAKILSVLLYPDKKDERFKVFVIRVQTINPIDIIDDLINAGYEVLWPNLPGMSK